MGPNGIYLRGAIQKLSSTEIGRNGARYVVKDPSVVPAREVDALEGALLQGLRQEDGL